MGCKKRTPDIPARPWRWRRWPIRLWQQFLRYDPQDPIWPNRDRFVLSAGHASMLLYAMLYLSQVRGGESRSTSDWARCGFAG